MLEFLAQDRAMKWGIGMAVVGLGSTLLLIPFGFLMPEEVFNVMAIFLISMAVLGLGMFVAYDILTRAVKEEHRKTEGKHYLLFVLSLTICVLSFVTSCIFAFSLSNKVVAYIALGIFAVGELAVIYNMYRLFLIWRSRGKIEE